MSDDERRARLARRHALAPESRVGTVSETVRAMVCLHATEPANVFLSAAARADVSRADIERAQYDERSVVRQLAMRRTVFAFPRELLPAAWGSAARRVADQQHARLARDVVAQGIATDGRRWVEEACSAVLEALAAGDATTAELRAVVPALEQRLQVAPGKAYGGDFPVAPRVLATLAAAGGVVRGINEGDWRSNRPRWTLTSHWLGEHPAPLDADAGYAELVRRWLRSFGPGTEDDIVWWLGATRSAVRRALADVDAVAVDLVEGQGYLLPDDLEPVAEVQPWAALLPALDPTIMGWKGRDFYLGGHRQALFDTNGNAGPSAWWSGRVVGGWRQEPDGTVVVVPAESLPAEATAALETEAARLTDWLAGDVVNSVYQSPLVRRAPAGSR